MIIWVVQYSTGYDYNEIVGYYLNEKDANDKARQVNLDDVGIGAFVSDIEVN